MSSLYVRRLVRQWAAAAAAGEGLPFYDTINQAQDPKEPTWVTAEFPNATTQASTYCSDEETGVFDLAFLTRGGQGDERVLEEAEAVMAGFMTQEDPTHALQLGRAAPPQEFPAGDVPWFVVLFSVPYVYQPQKGADHVR